MATIPKPIANQAYTIKGHIKASGFKSTLKHCYYIDGEWYRPTVTDDTDMPTHRQPEDHEIGWDMDILPDDYVIDNFEKEDK